MNRRETCVVLLALLAPPSGARAQQPGRVYRVGWLSAAPPRPSVGPVWDRAITKLGWIVGQNLVREFRVADGHYERLPALAAELVKLDVDVIVAVAAPETEAAKQATRTIPILFMAHGDPVGRGHVASLARPGGNITGASQMLPELGVKRLQLIRQVVPGALRIAVLWNAANPTKRVDWQALQEGARTLGLSLVSCEFTSQEDHRASLETASRAKPDALMTLDDPLSYHLRTTTVEFAAAKGLPAIYGLEGYVEVGGLMSYHTSQDELLRLNAYYVDKILKGAKPAELPVQQPTNFSLAINLGTAKALNMTIPKAVLALAEQVVN